MSRRRAPRGAAVREIELRIAGTYVPPPLPSALDEELLLRAYRHAGVRLPTSSAELTPLELRQRTFAARVLEREALRAEGAA